VSNHHAHFGRLADEAGRRFHVGMFETRDHAAHPYAADLLVVEESKMDRPHEGSCKHVRYRGETAGVEAFHVGRAASIEPAVARSQPERVARP
jgi:hypothetical protein